MVRFNHSDMFYLSDLLILEVWQCLSKLSSTLQKKKEKLVKINLWWDKVEITYPTGSKLSYDRFLH